MQDKFVNATFARYTGRCVILLGESSFLGAKCYMVRFFGSDKPFKVLATSLTEF